MQAAWLGPKKRVPTCSPSRFGVPWRTPLNEAVPGRTHLNGASAHRRWYGQSFTNFLQGAFCVATRFRCSHVNATWGCSMSAAVDPRRPSWQLCAAAHMWGKCCARRVPSPAVVKSTGPVCVLSRALAVFRKCREAASLVSSSARWHIACLPCRCEPLARLQARRWHDGGPPAIRALTRALAAV